VIHRNLTPPHPSPHRSNNVPVPAQAVRPDPEPYRDHQKVLKEKTKAIIEAKAQQEEFAAKLALLKKEEEEREAALKKAQAELAALNRLERLDLKLSQDKDQYQTDFSNKVEDQAQALRDAQAKVEEEKEAARLASEAVARELQRAEAAEAERAKAEAKARRRGGGQQDESDDLQQLSTDADPFILRSHLKRYDPAAAAAAAAAAEQKAKAEAREKEREGSRARSQQQTQDEGEGSVVSQLTYGHSHAPASSALSFSSSSSSMHPSPLHLDDLPSTGIYKGLLPSLERRINQSKGPLRSVVLTKEEVMRAMGLASASASASAASASAASASGTGSVGFATGGEEGEGAEGGRGRGRGKGRGGRGGSSASPPRSFSPPPSSSSPQHHHPHPHHHQHHHQQQQQQQQQSEERALARHKPTPLLIPSSSGFAHSSPIGGNSLILRSKAPIALARPMERGDLQAVSRGGSTVAAGVRLGLVKSPRSGNQLGPGLGAGAGAGPGAGAGFSDNQDLGNVLRDGIRYLPLDAKSAHLRFSLKWSLLGDVVLSLKKHKLKPAAFVTILRDASLLGAGASPEERSALSLHDSMCKIGLWVKRSVLYDQMKLLLGDDLRTADINGFISALDPVKRGQVPLWELSVVLSLFTYFFDELRQAKPTKPGVLQLGPASSPKQAEAGAGAATKASSKFGLAASADHDHAAGKEKEANDFRAQVWSTVANKTTGEGVLRRVLKAACEELETVAGAPSLRGRLLPVIPNHLPLLAVEHLLLSLCLSAEQEQLLAMFFKSILAAAAFAAKTQGQSSAQGNPKYVSMDIDAICALLEENGRVTAILRDAVLGGADQCNFQRKAE